MITAVLLKVLYLEKCKVDFRERCDSCTKMKLYWFSERNLMSLVRQGQIQLVFYWKIRKQF